MDLTTMPGSALADPLWCFPGRTRCGPCANKRAIFQCFRKTAVEGYAIRPIPLKVCVQYYLYWPWNREGRGCHRHEWNCRSWYEEESPRSVHKSVLGLAGRRHPSLQLCYFRRYNKVNIYWESMSIVHAYTISQTTLGFFQGVRFTSNLFTPPCTKVFCLTNHESLSLSLWSKLC